MYIVVLQDLNVTLLTQCNTNPHELCGCMTIYQSRKQVNFPPFSFDVNEVQSTLKVAFR